MRQFSLLHIVMPLLLVGLSGCATPRIGSSAQAQADPWEKSNRRVYAFNKKLDKYALRPVVNVYRTVLPQPVRNGVTNAVGNYEEPLSFVNAVLQGKIKQAFRTLDRFIINTTLGVGGLADVATGMGRPEEQEDFGQTFAVWGIKSGPFVVLPFFGPSTVRDGVGLAGDLRLDPGDYIRNAVFHPTLLYKAGQISVRVINLRSRLVDAGADGVLSGSLDEYATVRSAYLQSRQNAYYDGNPPQEDDEALPPGDAPPAVPPAAPPSDVNAPPTPK